VSTAFDDANDEGVSMNEAGEISEDKQNRIILEIVELQREYYFENKNKETERQRKLRDIIDRATPLKGE
jgi:hypothetical protein